VLGDINEFLVNLNRRPAATDAAIRATEKQLNAELPREYKDFLRSSDGGDGFVGKNYLILWRVDELAFDESIVRGSKVRPWASGLRVERGW
jgi:cell wall assembly regulator SMI1